MFDFGGEFVFFDLVVLDVGDQVFEGFVFIDNNKDLKIKLNRYNIQESKFYVLVVYCFWIENKFGN